MFFCLTGGVNEFSGFVLAASRCQVGDVIESLVSSILPLLRLYSSPCPPPAVSAFNTERLQLYHLNVNHFSNLVLFLIHFKLKKKGN
jgi:hypothetical protein